MHAFMQKTRLNEVFSGDLFDKLFVTCKGENLPKKLKLVTEISKKINIINVATSLQG